MPLTYNDTTKVITAEYIVGDLKGNSLANAWTVDDFQLAMVAAGHGAKWTQQGSQHLIDGISIYITGAGTYVHFYNSAIQWGGTSTQTYLLKVENSAHFESGSETISTYSPKPGCMFIDGVTNTSVEFVFDAYINIYDSVFTCTKNIDAIPRPYVIYVRGNFANAILFKRCLFLNSEYFASYFRTAGSNYDNISYINCSSNQSRYGIKSLYIAGNQLYCPGLNAVGQFCDTTGTVGTRKFYDINSPSGNFKIRTGDGISTDQFVDSVVNITFQAGSRAVVGSKAIAEFYSRLNFYITNGLGANVKVYDKNDLLVFNDDIIDAGGELLNQKIVYYLYSREVLTIVPAVTYDITNEYYYPFRVVITKAGRQILEIDDIEITDCIASFSFGCRKYFLKSFLN